MVLKSKLNQQQAESEQGCFPWFACAHARDLASWPLSLARMTSGVDVNVTCECSHVYQFKSRRAAQRHTRDSQALQNLEKKSHLGLHFSVSHTKPACQRPPTSITSDSPNHILQLTVFRVQVPHSRRLPSLALRLTITEA